MVNLQQRRIFIALFAALLCNSSRSAFAFGLKPTQISHSGGLTKNPLVGKPPGRQSAFVLKQTSQNQQSSMPSGENLSKNLLSKYGAKKRNLGAAVLLALLCTQRQLLITIFSKALQSYESSLVTYPLRTKVLTGASLAVIGDYLAQLRETTATYDVPRAVSFAAFDSCYRMFQHKAFPLIVKLGQGNVLHAIFSKVPLIGQDSLAFSSAMERTLLYQFVVIPFFYYPVFFTFTGFIQGLNFKETVDRAKTSFLPCWKRNLLFWIPTQMVMFGLVDEKWQIPFVCVMGILWSLILSITAGKAKRK